MDKAGIYKLISPNGKYYIGQSIDLDKNLKIRRKQYNECK
jgi:hypothetical protein